MKRRHTLALGAALGLPGAMAHAATASEPGTTKKVLRYAFTVAA